ncbi:uncharacterized protein LOC115309382 [Ixodes scapularis]|uniref:uncharacterized protein LOC115309382 n=1 Tax=Ixodes scapularis TaxID=6945 RepID=UPI001A9E862F|nr:uncharacterized protein LOC115309382 [Ixodes scapularis]
MCPGATLKPLVGKNYVTFGNKYFSKDCTGRPQNEQLCLRCRYLKKLIQNQMSRKRKKTSSSTKKQSRRRHALFKAKKKLLVARKTIEQLQAQNDSLPSTIIQERLAGLPPKQRAAVTCCFDAASRKSRQGMKYDKSWILECILMRMRSPKLYEHIRKQNILALPSKSCLQTYIRGFKSGFGFNPNVFSALSQKTKEMDEFSLHGGIVFDEMKLSEHVSVKSSGALEGFVDLGSFTPGDQKTTTCDHGLVVMFQPFQGDWTQVLGTFASRSNVKAGTLSKILLEATLLAEQAGLFVDFVTCDGASWNRSMWKSFGIKASAKEICCKVRHPVDRRRSLHFLSDFPHLIKCIRNTVVSTGVQTPDGHVRIEHVEEAWKCDKANVRLKVMPTITKAHLHPNPFERMKVNLAFKLFSEEVLKGLFFYKNRMGFRSITPTENFVRLMERLIFVMTARIPSKALKPQKSRAAFLADFLIYLNEWEMYASKHNGGFISASTALDLRVTISSTLSLLDYLTSVLGYDYLLTANLSQDKMENFFSLVRQSYGCNDHPTPEQFLLIVNCLSFYNLAKPLKSGNSSPELLTALLKSAEAPGQGETHISSLVDELLDGGNWEGADTIITATGHDTQCPPSTAPSKETASIGKHSSLVSERSDSRLIYYIAGYVARKMIKKNPCSECAAELAVLPLQSEQNPNSCFTKAFDHGGLLYPTEALSNFVTALENAFTVFFSHNELHCSSVVDFLSFLQNLSFDRIGCVEHTKLTTANLLKFYVLTRLHFYTKSVNKERESRRERQKLLKKRRLE